jgi:hypothetical protein
MILPRFLDGPHGVGLLLPELSRDPRRFDERLWRNLAQAALKRDATPEDVWTGLAEIPGDILVATHVLADGPLRRDPALLERFVGFWRDCPDLAPGKKLLVVLFVKYQHGLRFWSRRAALRSIAALDVTGDSRLTGAVLTPLQGVQRQHAEDWARSCEVTRFHRTQELIDEIRILFRKTSTIPMEELAPKLKDILQGPKEAWT